MRSDRGGEYYGRYLEDGQALDPFAKFLQEQGIFAQYTMSGSPNQICQTLGPKRHKKQLQPLL